MKRERTKANLTEGPPGLILLKMAVPMTIGILAMLGFNMIDTYFVGQLGTQPLAAMAVTFPVVMVVTSLALGLGVSTSIAVSRAIGGGGGGAARLTTDAISLGLIVAGVLWLASLFWLDSVVAAIGGHGATYEQAMTYLRVWFCGLPFVVIPIIGNMAIRATGDTVTPSALMVVWIAVNAVLDPVMIFGFGGVPGMGIAGAAWATVISRLFSCLAVLAILWRREHLLVSPFGRPRVVLASWRLLGVNAVPIALNNLITPVTAGALTRIVVSFSDEAVAGVGVAMRIQSFGMTPVFALQSVVGVYVGQNAGAGAFERVRQGLRSSMRFGLWWGTVLFGLLILLGAVVVGQFTEDPQVVWSARLFFAVVGGSFGCVGVYLTGSAGLNAQNRASLATAITVVTGLGIGVGMAWTGQFLFDALCPSTLRGENEVCLTR